MQLNSTSTACGERSPISIEPCHRLHAGRDITAWPRGRKGGNKDEKIQTSLPYTYLQFGHWNQRLGLHTYPRKRDIPFAGHDIPAPGYLIRDSSISGRTSPGGKPASSGSFRVLKLSGHNLDSGSACPSTGPRKRSRSAMLDVFRQVLTSTYFYIQTPKTDEASWPDQGRGPA